ncbi:uncharacterized protein [Dermacentor albipictus]|uniref:uncharacterized protein isoform X1 n=1 Tax=Dermacentor albipictus TaxID=60249 RepID=UPI0038FCC563
MCAKLRSFIVSLLVVMASIADSATEDSCANIQMPSVSNLGSCLNSSCDPSQDLIDAVGPFVMCVYEALKELKSPVQALEAYHHVLLQLVTAVENQGKYPVAIKSAITPDRIFRGTTPLTYCSDENISVSLPSALVGKCKSVLGTSCETSERSLDETLVSHVECLLVNALRNAPQDKITALVCGIISHTDRAAFVALPLWFGLYNVNRNLCPWRK